MRHALQNLLYARYPDLYRQKDLPMNRTCMCWGFACHDGWFGIIDAMSKTIVTLDPTVQATQVKEKFASLHFYYSSKRTSAGHAGVRAAVSCAEMMSTRRCEVTGRIGEVMRSNSGWYATLSPEEALALADAEDRPREFFSVEKSDTYWPPSAPDLADRLGYSKAEAERALYARHVACLSGDSVLDFPPSLFDLVDVGLHVISCRPYRSEPGRPLIVVKQVIWSDKAGLSIGIDQNSLRRVAEVIAAENQSEHNANPFDKPSSIDAEIKRLKNNCQGVQTFIQVLSSKTNMRDGRIGPVDDEGNLIDE
jgi:hypothetical protein